MLVLLPTESNKVKAQWQGPYHVVRKVGLVDYEVDMLDWLRRKRIFPHQSGMKRPKLIFGWKLREMESVRKKE